MLNNKLLQAFRFTGSVKVRSFVLFLFLFLCSLTIQAQSLILQVDLGVLGANPATNRQVAWQQISPTIGNLNYVVSDPVNGQVFITNPPVGPNLQVLYPMQFTIQSPPGQRIQFRVTMLPNDTGTIDASNRLSNPGPTFPAAQEAWSIATSEGRYALGGSATNSYATLTLVTNISTAIANSRQLGSQTLTNLSATGAQTNSLIGTNGVILATNAGGIFISGQGITNGYTSIVTSNPASFYTVSNPSGYIASVPPATTNWVYPSNNPSGFIAGLTATNSFYPSNNPSGFIAGVPPNATNVFYPSNNPSSFLSAVPAGATNWVASLVYATNAAGQVYTNNVLNYATLTQVTNVAQLYAGVATNAIANNNGIGTNITLVGINLATNISTHQAGGVHINDGGVVNVAAATGSGGEANIASSLSSVLGNAQGLSTLSSQNAQSGGESYNSVISSLSGLQTGGSVNYSVLIAGAYQTNYGNESFVAGTFDINSNYNSFIWSDGTTVNPFYTITNDEFAVHAQNGVAINTNSAGTNSLNVFGGLNASAITVNGTPVLTSATVASVVNGTNTFVTNNGSVYGVNVYNVDSNGAAVYNFGAASNYANKVSLAISNAPQFALAVTNQSTGNTLSNLQLNGSPQVNGTITVGSGSILDMNDGNIEDINGGNGEQNQILTSQGNGDGVAWQYVTNLNCATTSAPTLFNPTFWGNITIGGLYQRTTNGVLSVNGYTAPDTNGNQTYIRVSSTLWVGTNYLTAPTWTILTNGLTCLAQSNGVTLATSSTLNGLYTPTIGMGSPVVTNGSAINENGVMHLGTLFSQFLEGNGGMLWGLTNSSSFATNAANSGSFLVSPDGGLTRWTSDLLWKTNSAGNPTLTATNPQAGMNFAGTSTMGTLIVTNLNQQVLVGNGSGLTNVSAASFGLQTNLYFIDPVNGNDAVPIAGKVYKTLGALTVQHPYGLNIIVYPGLSMSTNGSNVVLPDNTSIWGYPGATIGGQIINIGNNDYIAGMTFSNQVFEDSSEVNYTTNDYIYNCTFNNFKDVDIFVPSIGFLFGTIQDCHFYSGFDAILTWDLGVVEDSDVTINYLNSNTKTTYGRPLYCDGTIVKNCRFITTNNPVACADIEDDADFNNQVEVDNCILQAQTTNLVQSATPFQGFTTVTGSGYSFNNSPNWPAAMSPASLGGFIFASNTWANTYNATTNGLTLGATALVYSNTAGGNLSIPIAVKNSNFVFIIKDPGP